MLDYLVGIVLILSPWIFDFDRGGPETIVPVALGLATLIYSLFTAYEMGPIKLISFRAHLTMDAASGLFLMASPWLLNFHDTIVWPHVAFGILEITVVILTRRQIRTDVRDHA